ncbi:primosomal protein N' [Legionella waltersii]|uniref:Replication restart protein PriA n=1 Tax=Legionella waltersii TaxID=66969 RepID=A0A0W1A4T1_9GAMM|nr:primosomal protein N' [Legionella waltersii]KTD76369.1 primosomal protein N' (replication factor Y) [Legionella waltersii]SNV13996.1 primosomal protein N' (replication factor Y) (superfamily II helicase) [Legionella waltersii]
MSGVYQICVPNTSRDYFEYSSDELNPCIGARVWVPFKNQIRLGVVLQRTDNAETTAKLKSIHAIIDNTPLLSRDQLDLAIWLGAYYQSPLSEVVPLILPQKYRQGLPATLPLMDCFQLLIPYEEAKSRLSPRARKQQEILEWFSRQNNPVTKQTILQEGFSTAQLNALLNAELITVSQELQLPTPSTKTTSTPLSLNTEQAQAVETIGQHLQQYHSFLLQGVTGSGKTEVYLQVIAKLLAEEKQVLVLVPEIGLTPQLLSRFTERFNQPMAVLHSNLNETERQIAWQLANENHVKIVIGTRSAIFTPMPRLGLIIIDEEHDSSFKQMEGVRYSARDTALMRAHLTNIPIILGSATPSLESLYNCQQKKHTLLRLSQKAISKNPLHYQLIDIRAQTMHEGLAATTLKTIKEHLEGQNQVLVFINRRGFAPVLLCHQCGWMADCKACDSHLTLHRQIGQMICHHCGLTQKVPSQCLRCKSHEIIPIGSGTQRIYDYLSKCFPETNILRIDRDEVRKKNALHSHLDKIHKGEAQLIVGTQMLAKGHHFPRLTLVVVVDADAGLYNQDFRAIEHLGQLLIQVSGRAGRAEHPGEVLIQTHLPGHPLLNSLVQKGYEEFAHELLTTRAQAELPPYHYLAVIRAQGKNSNNVMGFLKTTKDQIQMHPLTIMGPAPAPMPRKANQHRMQLLIKSPSRKALKSSLTQVREWLTMNNISNGIRWNVDVDPMDLS